MEIQFLIPVLRGLCLPTFITRTLRNEHTKIIFFILHWRYGLIKSLLARLMSRIVKLLLDNLKGVLTHKTTNLTSKSKYNQQNYDVWEIDASTDRWSVWSSSDRVWNTIFSRSCLPFQCSRFIVYRKKTFPNVNQWKRRCFLSAQELQAVGQVTQTENL